MAGGWLDLRHSVGSLKSNRQAKERNDDNDDDVIDSRGAANGKPISSDESSALIEMENIMETRSKIIGLELICTTAVALPVPSVCVCDLCNLSSFLLFKLAAKRLDSSLLPSEQRNFDFFSL